MALACLETCHWLSLSFVGLYYQIAHKNLPEFLCVMFPPRDLWIGKAFSLVIVCQMEKQLLGPLQCSLGNSIAVDHPV
jgi:hypothetical protein